MLRPPLTLALSPGERESVASGRTRPGPGEGRARRGLTLIELSIALAIIVVMFAAVIYGMGALTGARAKEASTELAGVIRNLYDTASLTGKTCRLVFTLPEAREEGGTVSYRAECAKGAITAGARREDEMRAADQRNKKKDAIAEDDRRFARLDSTSGPTMQELQAREKNRVDEAAKFSGFTSDDVQDHTLPSNVRLEVWTAKQHERAKAGTAFLYFFPQGFTERSQVWVRQGSNVWTITVAPLTGKTVIHSDELEIPRT